MQKTRDCSFLFIQIHIYLHPLSSFVCFSEIIDPYPQQQQSAATEALNLHAVAVVRRPDASDGGVDTLDGLVDTLELLTAGVAQQLGLLENGQGLHVAHADGLCAAVDVVSDEHGVLGGSGRHVELDLGMGGGELGEEGLDETPGEVGLVAVPRIS